MWYVSATAWTRQAGAGPRHHYHIRYAESTDGVDWERDGRVCIDYADAATSTRSRRPCVVQRCRSATACGSRSRGDRYRIGYAESADGADWTRRDATSAASCRAAAGNPRWSSIRGRRLTSGRRYMLYNGNDYGRTGVGVAVWEEAG